jgi:hypothetical protein
LTNFYKSIYFQVLNKSLFSFGYLITVYCQGLKKLKVKKCKYCMKKLFLLYSYFNVDIFPRNGFENFHRLTFCV